MKIAQVAPLIESVPPRLYGGTERITSYLTEELVRLGHEVTLFASGDSITSAELVSCCTRALRLDPSVRDTIPHFMLMIDKAREHAGEFDVLHFHLDLFHFPLFRSLAARTVTTLHGRQDLGDLKPFYSRFSAMPLVSISHDQRKSLPYANFVATIHHGIPADLHRPSFEQGRYLAFLGRISPEQRPDRAIRIARAAGIPLKIAAKVDKVDEEYFRNKILPLIDGPGVEFIGEINEREKARFLGEAAALLFPVDWPEPFGLVMIEAMACGTPVLAFRCGSIPEIIEDGVTGQIVGSEAEASALVKGIKSAGGQAVSVQADVSKVADVSHLFDAAEKQLGGVDVLVNNAGIMALSSLATTTDELFDRHVSVNLKGTFNGLREAAKRLRDGGRIINFSSSVVALRLESYGVYAATKAAVEALTGILSKELRGRSITVNAIAPGPTATDLFLHGKTQELIDHMAKMNPLERLGTPQDIAAAVSFLAGPDGAWINGQVLRANGGMI